MEAQPPPLPPSARTRPSTAKADAVLTPAEYLASVGVSEHLRTGMNLLLEYKPLDPASFLAQFFQQVAQPPSLVNQAYTLVKYPSIGSERFAENVAMAYASFQGNDGVEGREEPGLSGSYYAKLLRSLSSDLPASIQSRLVQELCTRNQSNFSFEEFRDGVLVARAVSEFYHAGLSRPISCEQSHNRSDDDEISGNAEDYRVRSSTLKRPLNEQDLHSRIRNLREHYLRMLLDPRKGLYWTSGLKAKTEFCGVQRLLILAEGAILATIEGRGP